jgi:tetratricopeptide (TPR) repeat protein
MILLFLALSIEVRTDSLEKAFAQNHQIETLIELNKCYLITGQFHESMALLGQNERYFPRDGDKSLIMFELGNAFMFVGETDKAHDTYLQLISRYPQQEIANDAAERLYLIETIRQDTASMKRLINVVRMYETAQYGAAVDSAQALLNSAVSAHAYYYLALAYRALGNLPLTLGALQELNSKHAGHKIYEAFFLQANVYLILGEVEKAEEILKDLIVREPNTIYALKAREKLARMERNQ